MQHQGIQLPVGEQRIVAIRDLAGGLLCAGPDVDTMFRALANTLTTTFADACAVRLDPAHITLGPHRCDPRDQVLAELVTDVEPGIHAFATEAQARSRLPRLAPYIERFDLRALAVLPLRSGLLDGLVIATRDRAFDADDLAAIETCITCTALAAESARQLATERGRIAAFQRQVLGVVAHDLRGSLGAMIVGSERLAADGVGADVAACIVSFANRMRATVEQLLESTRVQLGDRHESC